VVVVDVDVDVDVEVLVDVGVLQSSSVRQNLYPCDVTRYLKDQASGPDTDKSSTVKSL